MAQITLKGNPINTVGELPKVGNKAPDFVLTKTDLSDVTLKDFDGKTLVLNIFPSVDTDICATSVRKFNAEISKYENAAVLCISRDLPFALGRFCGAEGLNNVIAVSELRNLEFGKNYGVRIMDGPLAGLLARSVVIIDSDGKVVYTQQVPEIVEEPDYESALDNLNKK
ncbi:MAG: thiol peroxidase [Desulfobacterales bacterium]